MAVPSEALVAADELVGLRNFSTDDVEAITAACNDADIARWTSIPSPYTTEFARLFVMLTDTWRKEGSAFHFAVVDRHDCSLCGSVGLDSIKHPPVLVGYWVAPWARRRGVASHALRLVTDWAFDHLQLESISLFTKIGNGPSERVAANAGYTFKEVSDHNATNSSDGLIVRRWVHTRSDTPKPFADE